MARDRGVLSSLSFLKGLAPAGHNQFPTTEFNECVAGRGGGGINGRKMPVPLCSSNRTTRTWPRDAAAWRGVRWFLSIASILAPVHAAWCQRGNDSAHRHCMMARLVGYSIAPVPAHTKNLSNFVQQQLCEHRVTATCSMMQRRRSVLIRYLRDTWPACPCSMVSAGSWPMCCVKHIIMPCLLASLRVAAHQHQPIPFSRSSVTTSTFRDWFA
jgi:hypothetical protein